MTKRMIQVLIEGGKATPAPPLGPSLSVYKVNIGKIIQEINDKTKEYEGMKVPINIVIDDETKEYEIKVGVPPVSSLIAKELGLKKIAPQKEEESKEGEEKEEEKKKEVTKRKEEKKEKIIVGNLTMEQVIKITKLKKENLLAKDMKKAVKEIVSSVVSMPLTIEGKNPKDILKEIDEGKWNDKF